MIITQLNQLCLDVPNLLLFPTRLSTFIVPEEGDIRCRTLLLRS